MVTNTPKHTTVRVSFHDSARKYTYKTTELNFKRGDRAVVVDPRGEFKVVTIMGVDAEPQIFDFELKWIVCKVDTTAYDLLTGN